MEDPTAYLFKQGKGNKIKSKKRQAASSVSVADGDVSSSSSTMVAAATETMISSGHSKKKKKKKVKKQSEEKIVSAPVVADQPSSSTPISQKNGIVGIMRKQQQQQPIKNNDPYIAKVVASESQKSIPISETNDKRSMVSKQQPKKVSKSTGTKSLEGGFNVVKRKKGDREKSMASTIPRDRKDFAARRRSENASSSRNMKPNHVSEKCIENPRKSENKFWKKEVKLSKTSHTAGNSGAKMQAKTKRRTPEQRAGKTIQMPTEKQKDATVSPSIVVYSDIRESKLNPWVTPNTENDVHVTDFGGVHTEESDFPKLGEKAHNISQRRGNNRLAQPLGDGNKKEDESIPKAKWDDFEDENEEDEDEEEIEEEANIPVSFLCTIVHEKDDSLHSFKEWKLYVVGDVEELGDGDPTKGMVMAATGTENMYMASLDCFPEDAFNYFYALVSPDGSKSRHSSTVHFAMSDHGGESIVLQNHLAV